MRRPYRVLVLVVPLVVAVACSTTATRQPQAVPTVNRAQVGWMNTVCGQLTGLGTLGPAPAPDPVEASLRGDRDYTASSYVGDTARTVGGAADALSTLPPLGSPAADRFAAGRLTQLTTVRPDLDRLEAAEGSGFDRTAAQSRDAANRVGTLVASLKPTGPGLPEVASSEPALATAYDLAPACDPIARQQVATPRPSPAPAPPAGAMLPAAADGTNLAACADGSCEVRVGKPTLITVAGTAYSVNTDVLPVTVTTDFGDGGSGRVTLGVGGTSSFGNAGRTTAITLTGATGGAAVLRFATT